MLTNDSKRKLIAFGVFALPIAIVKIASTTLGGPAGAQAQTTLTSVAPPPPVAAMPVPELTSRERTVVDHIARLEETAFGATPLLHVKASGGPVAVKQPPKDPGVPSFRVKAIMVSSTGNRALVGGKAYRVGDELNDTSWIIIDINGTTRSVTIQEPGTGRVASSSVEGPAGRD